MSLKYEFVRLAEREDTNVRELCRRFAISPPTAYKLLGRYAREGEAGLADRLPDQIPGELERAVLAARCAPCLGRPQRRRHPTCPAPAPSPRSCAGTTGTPRERTQRNGQRFEHAHPNDLWQMDFKGHFPTGAGRCHPLTVLDDHSRCRPARRAHGDGEGGTDRHLPQLRLATADADGQRRPVGQRRRTRGRR